jgi:ArsR family transcriptional regulator
MNMSDISPEEQLSQVFRAISTPVRFQILAAIGKGEACVCHLEALLNLRQAYISQQLMELREAGLLDTRRDGRYIFYRLTEPDLLDLTFEIGKTLGVAIKDLEGLMTDHPLPQCCCPNCTAQPNLPIVHQEAIYSQKQEKKDANH